MAAATAERAVGGVHRAGGALHRLGDACGARLSGPGGLYNVGNAIGLLGGIALTIGSTSGDGPGMRGGLAATVDHLAGDSGAMALTAATAIFLWSGEVYRRAWANGSGPDRVLNRRGDLLSALGALLLGVALLMLGQVMLAATAGLLHAIGKFGSARDWRPAPGWRSGWPDFYRSVVLASRVPAVLAALVDLSSVLAQPVAATPLGDFLAPLTLLVCYVLWSSADLMLFTTRAEPRAAPAA